MTINNGCTLISDYKVNDSEITCGAVCQLSDSVHPSYFNFSPSNTCYLMIYIQLSSLLWSLIANHWKAWNMFFRSINLKDINKMRFYEWYIVGSQYNKMSTWHEPYKTSRMIRICLQNLKPHLCYRYQENFK